MTEPLLGRNLEIGDPSFFSGDVTITLDNGTIYKFRAEEIHVEPVSEEEFELKSWDGTTAAWHRNRARIQFSLKTENVKVYPIGVSAPVPVKKKRPASARR